MSATASCKFPLLNEWKEISSKNIVLDVIDNVLSGVAQIGFNDNSFAGLLMIIATYIGSPVQAIAGVWAALIATLAAYAFGVPKGLIRTGLYGFNAALCGVAIPALVFPGSPVTIQLLLYSGIAAIFAVVLQMGFGSFLSKWNVPSLALPYSTTLLLFVPAALSLGNLNITRSAPAIFDIVGPNAQGVWTFVEFIEASLNGIAQVLWIENPITGALYLVAVLMASRIDVVSTIVGALVSTLAAIALGLPKDLIVAGVYGFNAVLLMKVITRGFLITPKSYFTGIVLSVITVVFTASLRVIFAPIGAIASFAFPYAILCIVVFLGRDMFKNMTYVPASNWGVPETIKKDFKPES